MVAVDDSLFNEPDGEQEKPDKKSAATVLVDLAEQLYEFGISTDGETFGVPRPSGDPSVVEPRPSVVLLLRGGHTSLRKQLAREYRRRNGKVAPAQALTDALTTLDGFAEDTEPRRLWQRVARHDGALWLDLGDHTGRAVRIDGDGWSIVDRPPVLFRRTVLTGPLPEPVPGGHLYELWDWLNVTPQDRPLILAELVARLWPDHPHVVVGLFGEQGTGKSTAAKVLAQLLDPGPVPLRKPPKDAEQWVVAAAGSWVVALDNLSGMPDWLSDSICRASTGDGDVRRKLYADGDLALFAFRRCVILTGIDLGALNGDLAERLLSIVLEPIAEAERRDEEDIWPQWSEAHPRILGAVLDLVASIQAIRHSVELASRPRMADFARTLGAVDQALGTDGLARYVGAQAREATDSLTGDSFITAIAETLVATFTGTAAELLTKVTPGEEKWRPPKGWPTTARGVTQRLTRQATVMRKAGWEVTRDDGRNHRNVVIWTITPAGMSPDKGPDEPSPSSHPRTGEPPREGARHASHDPGEFLGTCSVCGEPIDPSAGTIHPGCQGGG